MSDVVVVLHHGNPDGPLDRVALARLALARSLGGRLVSAHPLMGGPLGPCRSTREEAVAIAQYLLPGTTAITLVTSASHMGRARRTFERAGFTVSPRTLPTPSLMRRVYEWAYEIAASVEYRVRGWA